MLRTKQELAHLAIDAAEHAQVPPALVCSIIEHSSHWDASMVEWEPPPWLLNSHPNDYPGGEREYLALGTRWGLMQFMGSRLKQAGWTGEYSSMLREPKHNLEAGCYLLRQIIGNGQATMKMVLTNWYGMERRGMVEPTLRMIGHFERFVAERPAAGKVPVG